jgi:uncharacterized protein YbjT (DUF2867 family)
MAETTKRRIVLSGASGFVGKRLVGQLAARYDEVRCLSRDPIRNLAELPATAIPLKADLLDPDSLSSVFEGAEVAFYLVHGLNESGTLLKSETTAAQNFAAAAQRAGIRRIIYLGALGTSDLDECSPHIQSRRTVGDVLRRAGVPVTEFRASVVIGNGSMPFEVIRALVERLPFMITPRWVRMKLQPISADDVIDYLLSAVETGNDENAIYEIGGQDVVSYETLLRTYERARNLRRLYVGVPVITPRLSSHWLRLVTPAHFKIARKIVESAGQDSIVKDQQASIDFPIKPVGIEEAIARAVTEDANHMLLLADRASESTNYGDCEKETVGTHFVERRSIALDAKPEFCFEVIKKLGGKHGWYWGDWLWQLRGILDQLVGGSGLRRHLTSEDGPSEGEILDFWTVERLTEGSRLTLRAEMKLPGTAWLDFQLLDDPKGTRLKQTVIFGAHGLTGQLYWAAVQPIHSIIFRNMLRHMGEAARRLQREADEIRERDRTNAP